MGFPGLTLVKEYLVREIPHPQYFTVVPTCLFDDQRTCFMSGNCWFLASIGALTFQNHILAQVVPLEQTFNEDYCGLFHFRVNTHGTSGYYFLLLDFYVTLIKISLSLIYYANNVMQCDAIISIYENPEMMVYTPTCFMFNTLHIYLYCGTFFIVCFS